MYEYKCKIVKVIDGDTVDVDIDLGFGMWLHKERIRLYGVDTPESRTRDLEEKKYGLAAKDFVLEHLPIGSIRVLRTMKDKVGKFGRTLGVFVIDEPGCKDLNEKLVKHHYAVDYHGQSKDLIEQEHIRNREYITV